MRLLALLFLCTALGNAADVSGRWSGALTLTAPNGSVQTQPIYLILNQQNSTLTGSAGNDERTQNPIRNGRVTDDQIVFEVAAVSMRLRLNGAALEGTGSRGDPGMTAVFAAKRIAELTDADLLPRLLYEGSDRSPRILALREAVQTKGGMVVDEFWKSLAVSGAPLVESLTGNDQSYLVTFLWRGGEQTKTVMLVRGRFSQFQPANNLLSHIEGSDVWFKTLKLPRGSRFQYSFSENDPQSTIPPGTGERRTLHDPLNARHLPEDPGTPKDRWTSLLELPGALSQPWYAMRPGVPRLTVTKHRFKSEILNNERDILVYTPPGYERTKLPYPALYLFDGEDSDGLVFASQTIENLINDGKIPPIIVVRIANPSQAARDHELSCLPDFADFLARELVPYIRRNYNVSPDPAKTGVSGYSLGGLAAAYAGLKHPEIFGLVLAQSGSFWFEPTGADTAEPNWLAGEFIRAPRLALRFYIEAGVFEVDLQGRGGNILETSRDLRNVLLAKGYRVDYREFPGDHDYINWRATLADGLISLLGLTSK